jgi:hypothetical protein
MTISNGFGYHGLIVQLSGGHGKGHRKPQGIPVVGVTN